MTKKRLLITSPSKSGLPHYYFHLFEHLMRSPDIVAGWEVHYLLEGAQNALQISRNILADQAVRGGYDRTLMLDTDHPITIEHIHRILSHDHEKYDIVSGLYCMKKPGNPFFLGIRVKGAQPDENGLLAAQFLPTGFLSVSTAALRKMQAIHTDRQFYIQDETLLPPGPRPQRDVITELFPVGVNGPRSPQARLRRVKEAMQKALEKGTHGMSRPQMLEALQGVQNALTDEGEPGYCTGEDYGFCVLAHQAGLKMYLDVKCLVPHEGKITFPITNPAHLATSCEQIPEMEGDVEKW